MKLTHLIADESDHAVAELARLISEHLLAGGSIADSGTELAFGGGSEDFREAVCVAVTHAVTGIPKDKLLAIAMGRMRQEMREKGQRVLVDDELPPGFSSN